MKRILLAFICFFFFGIVFGSNIDDYIKQNFEYIDIGNEFKINNSYISNKQNEYYFAGTIKYLFLTDIQTVDYFVKYKQSSGLIANYSGSWIWIDKNENEFDKTNCIQLDNESKNLFDSYFEIIKIKNYPGKIFGKISEKNFCYIYQNDIYLPGDDSALIDLTNIYKNKSKIYEHLNFLQMQLNSNDTLEKIKTIYKYIITHAEYNFDTLNVLEIGDIKDYSPWQIYSFFDAKKIVCDGYVKVFLFFADFFDISVQRVLGQIQPVEKSEYNKKGFMHSWIKAGDVYFDPTFDDNGTGENFNYFAKSQKCFNVNHYMTGWVMLDDIDKRYSYMIDNAKELILECPYIFRNAIFMDEKNIDLMKDSIQNFDLDLNIDLWCNVYEVCNINVKDKQELLSFLKKHTMTLVQGDKKIEYILNDILSNVKLNNESYVLSQQDKIKIQNINKVLSKKISKMYKSKQKQYKIKVKNYLQKNISINSIGTKKRAVYEYLYEIFVVEKSI